MSDGLNKKAIPLSEIPHTEQTEGVTEKKERHVVVPAEHVSMEHPATATPQVLVTHVPAQQSFQKSPLGQEIENVLEEDLLQLYRELTPKQRKQFKEVGEKTAVAIEALLKRVKVTIIEIIRLIRKWLLLLPNINIFFLEQEAKIKAERILQLKDTEDNRLEK